ncbi:MAG: hypothetical protein H8E44_20910 [Planctomycetes bacterium]|nr:hypothetical protein [Planctomycetota bacterium]MBL7043211.1 hypothetical protein [Pirellulaceae bacterium]
MGSPSVQQAISIEDAPQQLRELASQWTEWKEPNLRDGEFEHEWCARMRREYDEVHFEDLQLLHKTGFLVAESLRGGLFSSLDYAEIREDLAHEWEPVFRRRNGFQRYADWFDHVGRWFARHQQGDIPDIEHSFAAPPGIYEHRPFERQREWLRETTLAFADAIEVELANVEGGVCLVDAALILVGHDESVAAETKKRWQGSAEYQEIRGKAIGVSPTHKQVLFFKPPDIVWLAEKIEGKSVCRKRNLAKRLADIAGPARPIPF